MDLAISILVGVRECSVYMNLYILVYCHSDEDGTEHDIALEVEVPTDPYVAITDQQAGSGDQHVEPSGRSTEPADQQVGPGDQHVEPSTEPADQQAGPGDQHMELSGQQARPGDEHVEIGGQRAGPGDQRVELGGQQVDQQTDCKNVIVSVNNGSECDAFLVLFLNQ